MKKIILTILCLTLATGCSSETQLSEDTKTIVTSFYPIEYITSEIVGDNFEVINLTQGKDPHSYTLTPQDRIAIQNSDLFIFQGAGLESWAEDFKDAEDINILEVSANLTLKEHEEEGHDGHSDHDDEEHHEEEGRDDHSDHDGEEHEEEDHDDHSDHDGEEHEEEDHSDHDDHNHGEFDPHTWLDPVLAQDTASLILDEIISIDTANQEAYTQNADAIINDFIEIDGNYAAALSTCSNKKAISSHDAFSYLEDRYSFELVSVSGLSPQSQPSSQKIQELIQVSEADSITHILEEEFTDQSFSDVVQSETQLIPLRINTLESTPMDNQDYISVMNLNLETFKQAFSCESA